MAAITYRTFIDGLEALTVAGITKRYTQGPPPVLQTANLPAQWVRTPGRVAAATTEIGLAFTGAGLDVKFRADLVVAVEATGQSLQFANFDAMVTMVDSVAAALRSDAAHILATGSPTWEIGYEIMAVGDILYHAVVAAVEVIA